MPDDREPALVELLRVLDAQGYAFVPPTIDTLRGGRLRRAVARRTTPADLFGWNRALPTSSIPSELLQLMRQGGIAGSAGFGRVRSRLRIARLGRNLLYHGPYPMRGPDAVFLGPDSYRFALFLRAAIDRVPVGARVIDLGCGAGAGAIALAAVRADLRLAFTDIDRAALRLARINALAAGITGEFIESDGLGNVPGTIDAIVANPPFLGGRIAGRHRKGGDMLGAAVSFAWLRSAMARLSPAGVLLMYTASAIVDGVDRLRACVDAALREHGFSGRYTEVDPDLFGGMLWRPTYRQVDRIAAVTIVAWRGAAGCAEGLSDPHG